MPERQVDPIAVYRDTVAPLYRFIARRVGGSRELAEDITQETYLRFIAQFQKGKCPEPPLPWLQTVARNLLLNHFRRSAPRRLDSSLLARIFAGALADTDEATAAIQFGLARLRTRWARLLEAYHLDGKSVATIAGETGLSERAVEGRLRRARQALRRVLEPLYRASGEGQ